MRVFANLFLIMFLADGGFSLMDELVPLLSPLSSFATLRNLLAETVILMAVAVYICLGIDRRLPKRIFLPQILFVLICPFSTWLFPFLADIRAYGLMAAAAQLSLGMLPLFSFRKGGDRCLTMGPEIFTAPFFRLKNTLIFSTANLLAAPFVLTLLALFAANAYMVEYSAGFMKLDPGGLRMTERVYTRDNRTIRLTAMIHVGNSEYYDGVAESIGTDRTIVLAEGVTDDKGLLAGDINYGKMAGYLGLTSQHEMQLKGRVIEAEDLESPRTGSSGAGEEKPKSEVDILRADADVSNFRPPTILLLNALGKSMQESDSFVSSVKSINSWSQKNLTPEMYEIIIGDIIHRRNMVVLGYLDKALERYDTVVIPWGALHMNELETEVLKRGFKLQQEQQRVSIDFHKMLSDM